MAEWSGGDDGGLFALAGWRSESLMPTRGIRLKGRAGVSAGVNARS